MEKILVIFVKGTNEIVDTVIDVKDCIGLRSPMMRDGFDVVEFQKVRVLSNGEISSKLEGD